MQLRFFACACKIVLADVIVILQRQRTWKWCPYPERPSAKSTFWSAWDPNYSIVPLFNAGCDNVPDV
jgi:hypothetical protein